MMQKLKSNLLPITALLLSLGLSACGADSAAPKAESGTAAPAEQAADSTEAPAEPETEPVPAEDEAKNDTDVTNENAGVEAQNPVSVTFQKSSRDVKDEDGTALMQIETEMPIVTIQGAEDAAAKINADIKTRFDASAAADRESIQWAREDYAGRKEEGTAEWLTSYYSAHSAGVSRMDAVVLSLLFHEESYTGGAHGNYGATAVNYDVNTGEILTLNDLAEDSEAFQAAVLDYLFNQANMQPYRERLYGDPVKSEIQEYLLKEGVWHFDKSGITFFADPYLLGPYAAGRIEFLLPYKKALELGLKEEYKSNFPFMEERYFASCFNRDTQSYEAPNSEPEYAFDLNGDGKEEGIAFYGFVYGQEEDENGTYVCFIDGKDWGGVIAEALGSVDEGYIENTYALYDADPADSFTEIAVLYTKLGEAPAEDAPREQRRYSYLFQYTPEGGLRLKEQLEGYVTEVLVPSQDAATANP